MTEGSNELLLNLASIPTKKKKNKSTANNAASQTKAFIESSSESKSKPVIQVQPKPRKINKNASNPIQKIMQKSLEPDRFDSDAAPTGILKRSINAPSQSVWKKFKLSNKGDTVTNDSFPRSVPTTRKKDTNSNEPKFKKVSFHESNPCNNIENLCKSDDQFTVKNTMFNNQNRNDLIDTNIDSNNFTRGRMKTKRPSNNDSYGNFKQKFNDTNEEKREYGTGKTTSLFYNNPEIPDIPHRAVNPVKEEVFSNVTFESLNLHPYMVKYLKESMGLTMTTTVQAKAIPILLEKKDALVRSQTGSGKTLAFALPILHKLQEIKPKITRSDGVLALIVLPTRELALQTYEVFNKLVKSYTWIVPGYLVGGEKRKSEKARLRKGITILIGTPGRLIDHIQHTKSLKLDKVEYLVIDEADRLLDLGYEKDISVLLNSLNPDGPKLLQPNYLYPEKAVKEKCKTRQTILLSATLSAKVQQLACLSLIDPVFVDACGMNLSSSDYVPIVGSDLGTETDPMVLPDSLTQKYVVVPPKLKLVTLTSFIIQCTEFGQQKMLIFVGTQDMVDFYTDLLTSIFGSSNEDNPLDSENVKDSSISRIEMFKLHGNMKQSERTEVFKTFRKSSLGVLLCTDVAARGLDLPEVDWVIQFTGPISVSDYVHRVGRTARGGQSGSSIIFLTPNEVSFIGKLENCQIRVREEKMEKCLRHLMSTSAGGRTTYEEEATKLQMKFEKLVGDDRKLHDLACKAYASWSRFYASYPKNMRDAFSVKAVHQGHYAKSFALRESPTSIIGYARKKNLNEKKFPRKRPRDADGSARKSGKFDGRTKLSRISEFDSGLEPLPKKKKIIRFDQVSE